MTAAIRELAPAKVNLVLRIGPVAANGLHEVCSLFASLELHDVVEVEESGADSVECGGVEGPNLAEAAIRAFREALASASGASTLPPLAVRVDKRIPVAGGMAGGSADAAAVLRAANRIAGQPFDAGRLREIAAPLGSDVPSQVEPAHAIVTGTGDQVERVGLPAMTLVLVPSPTGLPTADVFREAERLGLPRADLRCDDVRPLAEMDVAGIAARLENDLQPAAVSLRPELTATLDGLAGLGAQLSGSGPTVFGVFEDDAEAEAAALRFPGALVTRVAS